MLGGLFTRDRAPAPEQRDGWEMFLDTTPKTWSGMTVTVDSATQLLAVYGSVKLISDQISSLPIDVYRKEGAIRVPVTRDLPAWIEQPNSWTNMVDLLSQITTSMLLDGNSYSWKTYDSTGKLNEIIPIADDKVEAKLDGRKKVITVDGQVISNDRILHIPAMIRAGSVTGLSPVEAARQSIGLGLAALEFGSGFFDRDGNMPGVIELPKVAQPETMGKLARQWRDKRTRANKGMPGVLDDGATWKPTGVTSEQAQYLQTRQWTSAEIAGQLFNLDPSELGIPVQGSSLTYANLEQRNVRRLQVTLLPWIIRIERHLSALLPRGQYVKLNVDSILRGDIKTRYDAYKVGLDGKFLTVDEVRELDDRRPLTEEEKAELNPPPPTMQPGAAPAPAGQ